MKKIKDKKDVVRLDKINVVINVFLVILLGIFIINSLVMYYNNDYAYYFIKNIENTYNGFLYNLYSNVNYLSYIIYGVYLVFIIIYFSVDIYYEYISKKEIEVRSKIVNRFYRVFIIVSLYMIIPTALFLSESHLPNMDLYLFKETKDKTYTKQDLLELDKYLKDKVITLSNSIERDDNNVISTKINYNDQAVKDLLNISNEIDLLKGKYPKKSSHINDFMRGIVGSKTAGFTSPYSTYFDYNGAPTSVINTITHEFCHTKGLVRENETVYCAFLAGSKSDNELSQYAAYLDAFSWVSEALSEIDYYQADSIEDEVISRCLTDNITELCEIYTKNNEEYINGSKELAIASYYLKNYKHNKNELKISLEILKEAGATITVAGNELSVDRILELVDENSNNRILIKMDINKKKFNSIKDAISNKKLYLSIYQKNKEDQESKEKLDNPEKYYLAPFKDQDENKIINLKYGSVEYEYSRVARLLLEHYEKYGK